MDLFCGKIYLFRWWWSWQLPSLEVYDLSEENGLDTYMSIEVPVSEGDEARSLSQEELGQSPEDHWWFSHESTCTTSVFLKDMKDIWFLDQAIWREEHKSEYDLKKLVEEVKNVEVVMATLNGLPGSCDSFMRGMCARRKWLLSADCGKKKNLISEDQSLIFQRRSLNQWGIWRSQLLKNFLSTLAFG